MIHWASWLLNFKFSMCACVCVCVCMCVCKRVCAHVDDCITDIASDPRLKVSLGCVEYKQTVIPPTL